MTVAPLRLVYLMRRASDGAVKIGSSRCPVDRRSDVERDCGSSVELLGVAPGGYSLEAYLHDFFSKACVGGEWFQLSDANVRWILDHTPPVSDAFATAGESAHRERERLSILDALDACGWNRLRAAKSLGIPRRTFYRRLYEYSIFSS